MQVRAHLVRQGQAQGLAQDQMLGRKLHQERGELHEHQLQTRKSQPVSLASALFLRKRSNVAKAHLI
jgi:hypothetical protein